MFGFVSNPHPLSRRLPRLGGRRHGSLRLEELESRTLPTIYAPNQIVHAYGFDKLPYDGTGQTIAIVDAYDNPNAASDLTTFDQLYGLPDPTFTIAQPQGQPVGDYLWGMEIDLDVQWAHAVAPGANILLVEAQSNLLGDMLAAVDYAAEQPGVVAVSMSWGEADVSFETLYDSHFTTPPGHIGGSGLPGGVTFVAASGDAGGKVIWPSASTNVLSVGGTALSLDDSNNIVNEVGWWGSGGGPSKYEAEPDFQEPFQGYAKRTTPDVSYNADVSSAYYIYDSFGFSGVLGVYGTSAGTPQWAGLIALADQALAANNIGSLDGPTQTLPGLYNLANLSYGTYFNDIIAGSNGYQAGPGYDLVTGIGTPVADQIVQGLAAGLVPPPGGGGRAAPGSPFTPSHATHRTPVLASPLQPVSLHMILPGHPAAATGSTLSGNPTGAFLLAARTNFGSEIGQTTANLLTSPGKVAPAPLDGKAAAIFVQPTRAPSLFFLENRIGNSGSGSGVAADDGADDGSREPMVSLISDPANGAEGVPAPPPAIQESAARANRRQSGWSAT